MPMMILHFLNNPSQKPFSRSSDFRLNLILLYFERNQTDYKIIDTIIKETNIKERLFKISKDHSKLVRIVMINFTLNYCPAY